MTADWEARFLATTTSLPYTARQAPNRAIFHSNANGVMEWYAWERDTGRQRQLTDRKNGTSDAILSDDGEFVWWFDDTDGDEFGRWRRQLFTEGPDDSRLVLDDVPAGYSAGIALGAHTAAVGVSSDNGTSIYLARQGQKTVLLYQHEQDAHIGALSRDETLLAITHSEHGDSLHPDVRILRTADATTVYELSDGPGKGLYPIAFAPAPGDNRLLVSHERHGRPELLLHDVDTEVSTELRIDIPGELDASWYPDGRSLLIIAVHAARTTAHRFDIANATLSTIDTPRGVVMSAQAHPNGAVEYHWSNAAEPPQLRASNLDGPLLVPLGTVAPASGQVRDLMVEGPAGRIHALLSTPVDEPIATIFSVHGGPHYADEDSFDPWRAAYVDFGYQVIQVNYRGSTGYGSQWRDALIGAPGHTELADIDAVRSWAVREGLVDPVRCVLSGYSWGGYLTLLGLGTQPDHWCAGVAGVPVADYLAAYEDEMEPLKAMDRVLFGSTPTQNPEIWTQASPLTFVEQVRAPLLILAGANDPRCPIRQIDNYIERLTALNKPHEVYRFDAGHGSLVTTQRIAMVRAELEFLARTAS